MKKKFLVIILMLLIFLTTGCFKIDDMEDIDIITTNYPIEYVTNRLYGENSNVINIYPSGVNPKDYELTEKQLKDFSKNDLIVYNGALETSRDQTKNMLNYNKNLKIIDVSYGIDASVSYSDVWLNPSNFLMIAQNIKNELRSYITNKYIIDEVENQYELLKVDVSALEAYLKLTADNSQNKTIVCIDETMNFLTKYGFEVINLTEKGKEKAENIDQAKDLYSSNDLDYIFIPEYFEEDDLIKDLKENYGVEVLTFRTLEVIKDTDINNNDDFLSLMHENVSLITKETY